MQQLLIFMLFLNHQFFVVVFASLIHIIMGLHKTKITIKKNWQHKVQKLAAMPVQLHNIAQTLNMTLNTSNIVCNYTQ